MELKNKRHKAFADEYILNGFNAAQAYKKIYKKVTDESAKVLGHKLLDNKDIKTYLVENQKTTNEKYLLTKDKMIEELLEVITSCKTDSIKDRSNWLKAVDIMNRLGGFYQPDKIEHSGSISNITTIELIEVKKPEDNKD